MAIYQLTQDAKADLIEIRRFTVQQWGATQSQKYLSELRHTMQLLAENSSLGKLRPDVGSEVLSFPYASHVIYYMVVESLLVVFGVLHKRMVPNHHLAERKVM
jgi:toxin ParE1/3/4